MNLQLDPMPFDMHSPIAEQLYEEVVKRVRGEIRGQEPMAKHTSFGIGGPAELMVIPDSLDDLFELLAICESRDVPCMIIGRGANLLVCDGGIDGVVISLEKSCAAIEATGTVVRAGAGVSLNTLVRTAADNNLQGIEFCAGIPGSVGGALVMNAGAWGGSISDVVENVSVYDAKNKSTRTLRKSEIHFGYRKSNLPRYGVILEAVFGLKKGRPDRIMETTRRYLERRAETQPVRFRSAGSIFKNPKDEPAGALIERLGFKGYQHGGAKVSDVHANFIVNHNSATASDVLAIMTEIKRRARDAAGIELEEEIRIVGKER